MCTVGCEHLCEKVYDADAVSIRLIKESGAIILVRGNIP
jgi:hypothetical protein